MADDRPLLLLCTRDPLVERRIVRAADRCGWRVLQLVGPPGDSEPVGLLVALELDDALEVIAAWRAARPALPIVAYLSLPDAERWQAAEEAGADAVTTRGLADRRLVEIVDDRLSGRAASRRIRLAPYRDFAGRLGYVGRIDETPAGPIGIYHVGSVLHAVSDVCPHAGASLCEGALEGEVVTCPRHGSQFSVTTGERVRGPADVGLERFPVVVEAGEVFVELPAVASGGS